MKTADNWITHLALSSWNLVDIYSCVSLCTDVLYVRLTKPVHSGEAHLAFGTSDGSIGLVKILQFLKVTSVSTFGPDYTLDILYELQAQKTFEADKRGITALTWIEIPGRSVSTISS